MVTGKLTGATWGGKGLAPRKNMLDVGSGLWPRTYV
jgi:hypothetical protein